MTQLAITREETAVTRRAVVDDGEFSMILDTGKFEHLQRLANIFCSSTLIPEHFRGKENMANCFIAIQMAVRLRVDPLMFMQKSYIVHGKPGMEAQLAIALVNSSGLFSDPIEYQVQCDVIDDPFDPSYMVRAYAVRASTGNRIDGPWIDWKMVKGEGWLDKAGSKWKTMPAVMFMYRAATFFARTACPERLMGMSTVDELEDVGRSPAMQDGVNRRLAALMPAVEGAIIADAQEVKKNNPAPDAALATVGKGAAATGPAAAPQGKPTEAPRTSGRPGPKMDAPQNTPEPSPFEQALIAAEEWVESLAIEGVKEFLSGIAEHHPEIMEKAKDTAGTNLDVKAPESELRAVAINAKAAISMLPKAPEQSEDELRKMTASKAVDMAVAKGVKQVEKDLQKFTPSVLEAAKTNAGFTGSITGRKIEELSVVLYEAKLIELAARK